MLRRPFLLPASCWRPSGTATATVGAGSGTISGSHTVCVGGGNTISLASTQPLGSWSSSNTSVATVVAGTGVVTGVSSSVSSGVCTINYQVGTCTAATYSLTVLATPTAVTVTPALNPACNSTVLTATGGTGGTMYYEGTSPGSFSTATPTTTFNAAASGTYYFNSYNGTCWATAGNATETIINSVPTAVTVSGWGTFCGNTTLTTTGGTGGVMYYQGTTTGGTSFATPATTFNVSSSGNYYFRANNVCGWSGEGSGNVTINPIPTTITGTLAVCNGATTALSSTPSGGTWSTIAGTGSASITSSTGFATGTGAGNVTVNYTLPAGCQSTATLTVNAATLAVSLSPTSLTPLCLGATSPSVTASSSGTKPILNQNFNGTLTDAVAGTNWTYSNSGGSSAAYWAFVTSGTSYWGNTGDGSTYLEAAVGLGSTAATTVFLSPTFSTVGLTAAALTYNYNLIYNGTEGNIQVDYTINGGTSWVTIKNYKTGATAGNSYGASSGTWTASVPDETLAIPVGALGQATVQLRFYYKSNSNGYFWDVDNIVLNGTYTPTITWTAAPASGAGITSPGTAASTFSPTATGTYIYTASASGLSGACGANTISLTANPVATSTFSYVGSPYCTSGSPVSVTYAGGDVPAYTSTGGITLNGTTGTITPSTSTAGTYTITNTASNAYSCPSTSTTTVVINGAVNIASYTLGQSVSPTSTANFSVTATGTGLNYRWQENRGSGWNNVVNGADVGGQTYAGATTSSLTITNSQLAMNGYQYQCILTGTAPCSGATTTAATLNVAFASFTAQPSNFSGCQDGVHNTATFSTTVTGTFTSTTWQENQGSGWANLSNGTVGGVTYSGTTTAGSSSTLSLSGLTAANNGWQYRNAINISGTFVYSNPATLTVNSPVTSISTNPVSGSICTSGSGTFSVASNGSNQTYQWYQNGSACANDAIHSGVTTATMTVTNPTSGMNGQLIYCAVSSASSCTASTINSSNATLTVVSPVAITVQPASVTMYPGCNGTISLTATGTTPTYQWQVSTDGGSTYTNLSNGGIYSGVTTATLAFTSVTSGYNAYKYRCSISNTSPCAGSVLSSIATLTIGTAPYSVTLSPSSLSSLCLGGTTAAVTATPTVSTLTLLSQTFNSGLTDGITGTNWTYANTGGSSAAYWAIIGSGSGWNFNSGNIL